VTSRTYNDLSLRPVRVVTDVELLGDGGKAGGETTPARRRGFRASRRSEVAFMTGIGFVAEAEAYRL